MSDDRRHVTVVSKNISTECAARDDSRCGTTNNKPLARAKAISDAIDASLDTLGMSADDRVVVSDGDEQYLEHIKAVHDERMLRVLQHGYSSWVSEGRNEDFASSDGNGVVPYTFATASRCLRARRLHDETVLGAVSRVPVHKGLGFFATDALAPLFEDTYEQAIAAATVAAEAAKIAVERVDVRANWRRVAPVVYALTHLPGHHASQMTYGGYCFINNAAVCVRTFQAFKRMKSAGSVNVAIVDIDFHHGDGTQTIFADDNAVLTVSLHCSPKFDYPFYSGFADDMPSDRAYVNVPLSPGCDASTYIDALNHHVKCALQMHQPDLLVVAFGADTLSNDPDASVNAFALQEDDMVDVGKAIASAVPSSTPIVVTQEGGYGEASRIGTAAVNLLRGLRE